MLLFSAPPHNVYIFLPHSETRLKAEAAWLPLTASKIIFQNKSSFLTIIFKQLVPITVSHMVWYVRILYSYAFDARLFLHVRKVYSILVQVNVFYIGKKIYNGGVVHPIRCCVHKYKDLESIYFQCHMYIRSVLRIQTSNLPKLCTQFSLEVKAPFSSRIVLQLTTCRL